MKKKNLLILIVVAALIVIIAGIMIYTFIFKEKPDVTANFQDESFLETKIDNSIVEFSKDNDQDGDGLSDYDEIELYHTDMKNSDTDGDGHSDGDEVVKEFDPLVTPEYLDFTDQQRYKNMSYRIAKLKNYCFMKREIYANNMGQDTEKWVCVKDNKAVLVEEVDAVDLITYYNSQSGSVIVYSSLDSTGIIIERDTEEFEVYGFDENLEQGLEEKNRTYKYIGEDVINDVTVECFEISENTRHCLAKNNGLPVQIRIKNLVTISYSDFDFQERPQEYFVIPVEASISTLEGLE